MQEQDLRSQTTPILDPEPIHFPQARDLQQRPVNGNSQPKQLRDFLWYIASPYKDIYELDTGLEQHRFYQVTKFAAQLTAKRINVYCPILVSHTMRSVYPELKQHPVDKEWLEGLDSVLMARCDGLIVYQMDGWERSKGVDTEIKYFCECNKPFLLVPTHFNLDHMPRLLEYTIENAIY